MEDKNNQFDNENVEENNKADDNIEINDKVYVDICEEETDNIEDAGMSISIHANKDNKKESSFNLWKEIREWAFAIFFALVVVGLIKGFLFDFVVVDGRSMQTTLLHGDRLVLTKLGYTPKKGDIIVLDANYKAREVYIERKKQQQGDSFGWFDEFKLRHFPWEQRKYGIEPLHYVKRVIALEGDVIDINDVTNDVIVNGEIIDEPYLDNVKTYSGPETDFPYTIEDDCAFVMGDNREDSRDSRYTSPGTIPYKAVLGKAVFRFWPFSAIGMVD